MTITAKYCNPLNARFTRHKLALAIAVQIYAFTAHAGPTGGEIVGGEGSIEQNGRETTITQKTDRLAIDWQAFNIGTDERVEFVQPGQSSVALNRILGSNGSEILGRIDANGHVILVNPQGIVFGQNAVINVGGLIASGLQINPEDFLNGDLVFKQIEGTDGTVINSGTINAALGGNVTLLGKSVENRGLISAHLGRVQLAAGKKSVLTFDTDGLLGVQVDEAILQDELGERASVINSGEIQAAGGQVLLSASTTRDVFSQAMNWGDYREARSVTYHEDGGFTLGGADVVNTGVMDVSAEASSGAIVVLGENITHNGDILANSEDSKGGFIELHSTNTTQITGSGTVQTQGYIGGNIAILGKNVGLFGDTQVIATGTHNGGMVVFGGGREGLNTHVRNAEFAYIAEGATINVNAIEVGNGGSAIIFADDTARIYGNLSATGGQISGNGGFIETSGKSGFEIIGAPNVSSKYGQAGHWLIDPFNIEIQENFLTSGFSSENPFESSANSATLLVDDLIASLNSGATITVKTGAGGDQLGNITISSGFNFTGGSQPTLNLIAHNNIVFQNGVSITASKANNSVLNLNLHANLSGNEGSITFGNNTRIETGGGNFIVGHINDSGSVDASRPGAYNVDFSNATIDVTGPSYDSLGTFNTYFGNRNPSVASGDRQYLSDSGRIVVNASNNVNLGGSDGSGANNGSVTMNVRGRERELEDNFEKIHIIAGNDILLDANRTWTYDNNPTEILESGQNANDGYTTLKLEAGRDIDLAGSITYAWDQESGNNRQEQNDRLMIDLNAGGNVLIGGDIDTTGGHFIVRNALNVDFSGQTLDTSSRYGAGDLNIYATGDITLGRTPMFNGSAGTLRSPSLYLDAGGRLRLGADNLATNGTDIHLSGNSIDFNNRSLETSDGGNITLISHSDLELLELTSGGDLTVAARDPENQSINLTQTTPLTVGGNSVFDVGTEGNITLTADNLLQGQVGFESANNVTLQIRSPNDGTNPDNRFWLQLGHEDFVSQIHGDLHVTITRNGGVENPGALNVFGSTTIHADDDPVFLNNAGNDFIGAVSIGDGNRSSSDVHITTQGDLLLGLVNADELQVHAGGSISQISALEVAGLAQFTAGSENEVGNIELALSNTLTSVQIHQAHNAVINNRQDLLIAGAEVSEQLELRVDGDLSQEAPIEVPDLALTVSGATTLDEATNNIARLSGELGAGVLASQTPLEIGELNVSESFTLQAASVEQSGTWTLADQTQLTFEGITALTLADSISAPNTEENTASIIALGADSDSTFSLSAGFEANNVTLHFDGGQGGANRLEGSNQDNQWRILNTAPHSLNDNITFINFQQLKGGEGNDTFYFAQDADTNLTINGGDSGFNQVSYAEVTGNLEVALGDTLSRLTNIHLLLGNYDPNSANYARLSVTAAGHYRWHITADNAGEVGPAEGGVTTVFEGFNQLQGGSNSNHFEIDANLLGNNARIQGGAEGNTFQVNTAFSGNLGGGRGDDDFYLDNAISGNVTGGLGGNNRFFITENTRLTGGVNGGEGHTTIVGFNDSLTWQITQVESANEDHVRIALVSTATTLPPPPANEDEPPGDPEPLHTYFTNARRISALLGGDQDDQFVYFDNAEELAVDGGGGFNSADYSLIQDNISVTLGALDTLGLENIQHLIGNAENGYTSQLTAASSADALWIIDAGVSSLTLGENEVTAFSGFNQLHGAAGVNTFDIYANLPGANAYIQGGSAENTFNVFASESNAPLFSELRGGQGYNEFHINGAVNAHLVGGDAGNSFDIDAPVTGNITGGQSDDTFNLNNTVIGAISGIAGVNRFHLNSTVTGQVIGGSGDDTFNLGGVVTGNVLGTDGHNSFQLTANTEITGTLDGGQGTASLIGFDSGLTWHIDQDGDGLFVRVTATPDPQGAENPPSVATPYIANARNIQLLQGASGDDHFMYYLDTQSMGVNGGGGFNTADYSQVSGDVTVILGPTSSLGVSNIQRLIGNGAQSALLGPEAGATWTVSTENGGQVIWADQATDFEGFAHLHGGAGNDTFELQALVRRITGGAGTNTLNAEGLNQALQVRLLDTTLSAGALHLEDVQHITANAEYDNQLFSAAADNRWTITHINRGTVHQNAAQENTTEVSFQHFAYLQGEQDNRFELTPEGALRRVNGAPGQITGGAGLNQLLALTDRANHWVVDGRYTGALNESDNASDNPTNVTLDFVDIQRLEGHHLTDTFTFTSAGAQVDALDGGAGSNELRVLEGDNTWQIVQTNQGTLNLATTDAVVEFRNIENLTGGTGEDTFVFREAGQLTGLLHGGAGLGRVDLQAVEADWRVGQWDLNSAADLQLNIQNITHLNGNGQLHLVGSNVTNDWTITSAGGGVWSRDDEAPSLNFAGVGAITGGAQTDTFTLSPNGALAQLDGGGGENFLNSQRTHNHWRMDDQGGQLWYAEEAVGSADLVFTRIHRLSGTVNNHFDLSGLSEWTGMVSGGNGRNSLAGLNTDNHWHIGSLDTGTLNGSVQFEGIQNLIGQAHSDQFTLADGATVNGLLDGGEGDQNRLDLTEFSSPFSLNLFAPAADWTPDPDQPTVHIARIQQIDTLEQHQGRLQAGAGENTWTITGLNSGSLNDSHFQGFAELYGGPDTDHFFLQPGGRLSGSVHGGGGDNHLTSGYGQLLWQVQGINSGVLWQNGDAEAPLLEFSAIQNLQGGHENDQFELAAAARLTRIDGGGGDNILSLADHNHSITLGDANPEDGALQIRLGDALVTGAANIGQLFLGDGDNQLVALAPTTVHALHGGLGENHLDARALNQNLVVNLQTGATNLAVRSGEGTAQNTLQVSGIHHWQANPAQNNRFTGLNQDGDWQWTGDHTGQVFYSNLPDEETLAVLALPSTSLSFSGFQTLRGGSGNDSFNLNGYWAGRIEGDGGYNQLSRGSGTNGANAETPRLWRVDGTDRGNLNRQEQRLEFRQIAQLNGAAGEDHFTFTENGALSGSLDGGSTTGNRLTYSRPQHTWLQQTANVAEPFTFDTIQNPEGNTVLTFTRIQDWQGSGSDRLQGANVNQEWRIDNRNQGTIARFNESPEEPSDEPPPPEPVLSFQGFSTIMGGAGYDTFTLGPQGQLDGYLAAGPGGGALHIEHENAVAVNVGTTVNPLLDSAHAHVIYARGFNHIQAHNNQGNYLYGPSEHEQGYTWRIDGRYSGQWNPTAEPNAINTFVNFAHLVGGAHNDRFQMINTGSVGSINGGGGQNFMDHSATQRDFSITIGLGADTDNGASISNIHGLVGNNDGTGDYHATLRVRGGHNRWTIQADEESLSDGINDGLFEQLDPTTGEVLYQLRFQDFSRLVGGTREDNFHLRGDAWISGGIFGGGGQNSLYADDLSAARRLTLALMPENFNEIRRSDAVQAQGADTQFFGGIERLIGSNNQTTLLGLDRATQWNLNGQNAGTVHWTDNQLTYQAIGNLQGGAATDRFILNPGGGLSGWLSGGGGDNNLHLIRTSAVTVHLAENRAALADDALHTPALRILPNVGTLTAEPGGNHHLRLHTATDDQPQNWQITGRDSGRILEVNFSGFTHLHGSAGDDHFEFTAHGALSGILNGGAGRNTVDLTALGAPALVALGEGTDADLQVHQIHRLLGNPEWDTNRLYGPNRDNLWQITESDGGTLSNAQASDQTLRFSHFPILIGGSRQDRFVLSDNGLVTGLLDGGDGTMNSLDFSDLLTSLDVLVHGNERPEHGLLVRNFQQLTGNHQSRLIGPDQYSRWLLDEGVNQGQLSFDEGRFQLSFAGVSELQGGDSGNRFDLHGGTVTGQIQGGLGNDLLEYQVMDTRDQHTTAFLGGGGENTLRFTGGGNSVQAEYLPLEGSELEAVMSYSYANGVAAPLPYQVQFGQVQQLVHNTQVQDLRILGSGDTNNFHLSRSQVQLDERTPLRFLPQSHPSLTIAGQAEDAIIVTQPFTAGNRLTLERAAVYTQPGTQITAGHLILRESASAGTQDSPLATAVAQLSVIENLGEVYIQQGNRANLTLSDIRTQAPLSVTLLNGQMTQSQGANAQSQVSLSAGGALLLQADNNRWHAPLYLSAGSDLILSNELATEIVELDSNSFTLTGADDLILHQGRISGRAQITLSGDAVISDLQARHLELGSNGAVDLRSSSFTGQQQNQISAEGDVYLSEVSGQQLVVNTQGSLTAEETQVHQLAELNSQGAMHLAQWRGRDLQAHTHGAFTAKNLEVQNNATVIGDSSVHIAGASLAGLEVSTEGEAQLTELTLSRPLSVSAGEDIQVHSAGDLQIQRLHNPGQTIELVANSIISAPGASPITTGQLVLRSQSGIGASRTAPLRTGVSVLDALNAEGQIHISNQGPLTVERLRSNDNISLINSSGVTIHQESINAFFGSTPARYPDPKTVIPAIDEHRFDLIILEGSLRTDGLLDPQKPHIAAGHVSFVIGGVLAPPSPVIYVPGNIAIAAAPSRNRPLWGLGIIPDNFDDSDFHWIGDALSSTEQLIVVESLDEISEAVFTDVRNYFINDISILLPEDQRYDD